MAAGPELPEEGARLARSMADLLASLTHRMVFATCGTYLVWYGVSAAVRPLDFYWPMVGVTSLVVLSGVICLRLLGRHPFSAQMVWLMGLAAAISLAVYLSNHPEIIFLYALLPFMAAISQGWPAGIVAESAIAGLVIWWVPSQTGVNVLDTYAQGTLTVGALTACIGWAVRYTALTGVHWHLYSLRQADENLASARQHRAQLLRAQRSLDQAYSRLERTNAALVAAWKVADEAEHLKAEMVTTVSHELRTPLNLIVGFAEMMVTSPESYDDVLLPGSYRNDLNTIYNNARHLLALVDDVLDLALIQAGKANLVREEVDMLALVTQAVDMVHDYIAAKNLELHVDVQPGLALLWVDRLRIRQVLLNLLVNAARFTERGRITVQVAHQDSEIVVRVSDTGRGIRPDELPHIFEEFRSGQPNSGDWHSGSGLGLPISKRFVELHGGQMGVESTYLQGTSFWFTLPCSLEAQAARRPSFVQSDQPIDPQVDSRPAVVLAHSDALVKRLFQRHLAGYQIWDASDTASGLVLAQEMKAIALITQEGAPQGMAPDAPLVVSCSLPSSTRAATALGADDMLVKPVLRQELWAAIDRLGCPVQRVLIVASDPEIVRLFRRLLRQRIPAQQCLEAFTCAEASQLVETARPDLVLLDLAMADTDGDDLLRNLAADPDVANIPIIAVSDKEHDYLSLLLPGLIQIYRPAGFGANELVRTLASVFTALAPRWHPRCSTVPAPEAGTAESLAW